MPNQCMNLTERPVTVRACARPAPDRPAGYAYVRWKESDTEGEAKTMTTDTPSFFADPKVVVSLIAIVISLGSLIWTLANQWEQNRRWDALNLGRVQLSDVGFIIWKELSKEEALSTNWGYKPTLYSVVQDRVHLGKYQMPYELVLMDSNNVRIPNSNGFYTLVEAQQETERLKPQTQPNVLKHYQVQFNFKNTGSTSSKETSIRITAQISGNDKPLDIFKSIEPIDLLPSSSINAVSNFYVPLNAALPQIMKFSAFITYKDAHDKINTRELPIVYDEGQNYWTYGR